MSLVDNASPPVLVINRDRSELLRLVDARKVYRSQGGCDMARWRTGNGRVEKRLRELTDAGLVTLGADGRHYELTGDGEAALAAYVPPQPHRPTEGVSR